MLASAAGPDGTVSGSRDALFLPAGDAPRRVPWEQVASADWDADERVLVVVELAPWGEPQPRHRLRLDDPSRLLQLVRERVTASIVLQRHVPVRGRQEVRIVGRRAPAQHGAITWLVDYDAALDPTDPVVREAVGAAVARARADVGDDRPE
jgi:hypothetical protein